MSQPSNTNKECFWEKSRNSVHSWHD